MPQCGSGYSAIGAGIKRDGQRAESTDSFTTRMGNWKSSVSPVFPRSKPKVCGHEMALQFGGIRIHLAPARLIFNVIGWKGKKGHDYELSATRCGCGFGGLGESDQSSPS
jgi:hypothetical protein